MTPLEFLTLLYGGATASGFVEFRYLPSKGRAWMPWPTFEGHPGVVATFPAKQNVYFGVSLRQEEGKGTAEDVLPTHLLWMDLDLKGTEYVGGDLGLTEWSEADLREAARTAMAQLREELDQAQLWPTAIVFSGHGLQLYWRRTARSTLADTEAYNRGLAAAFGGDHKVVDVARILRVPGSLNLKNKQRPLPVEVWHTDPDARVTEAALAPYLDVPKPAPAPAPGPAPVMAPPAGNAHERYAQAALQREVDELRATAEGGRNAQLNRAAFSVGTLVGAGVLDEHLASHELASAAAAIGLEEDEIQDTLRSGLSSGKRNPRDLTNVGRHWENKPQQFGRIGSKADGQTATSTRELPDKPTLADYRDLVLDWCAEHGQVYRYHQTRRSWWQYHRGVYVEVLDEVMYQRVDKILQAYGFDNLKTAQIREVLDKIGREESVAALEVDQGPWELNTRNGILDLATGQLHEHTPEYFSTIQSAAAYRPEVVAHEWLAFLAQAVPSEADRMLLQEYAGLCLTGDTSPQRALLLVGEGGTGKSTYVRVLLAVLGSLGTSSALENIKDGSFLVGGLVGRRMCVVSELQRNVDWLPFKRITGEDHISVDVKNKTPFTVKLDLKLVILSNVVPFLGDDTTNNSLMRRFLPVSFNVRPVAPDPTLEQRLTHPDELSGVLNWQMEGLQRLQAKGMRFQTVDASSLAREIVEESNRVISFLRERCAYQEGASTSATDLYNAYRTWVMDTGHKGLSSTSFAKQLLAAARHFGKDLQKVRRNTGVAYQNVVLTDHPHGWEELEHAGV